MRCYWHVHGIMRFSEILMGFNVDQCAGKTWKVCDSKINMHAMTSRVLRCDIYIYMYVYICTQIIKGNVEETAELLVQIVSQQP